MWCVKLQRELRAVYGVRFAVVRLKSREREREERSECVCVRERERERESVCV